LRTEKIAMISKKNCDNPMSVFERMPINKKIKIVKIFEKKRNYRKKNPQ
jgi:hypothetical protein